jgi:hypothetical protein
MTLATIPDIEAILGNYLRTHPDIVALGARVGAEVPSSSVNPWVRITQLDAADYTDASLEYFIEYLVQVDSFAGKTATDAKRGQEEAHDVSKAVRAAMKHLEQLDLGPATPVVSCVRFRQHARLPDTSFEPPRQRYMLEAFIYAHPKAS